VNFRNKWMIIFAMRSGSSRAFMGTVRFFADCKRRKMAILHR